MIAIDNRNWVFECFCNRNNLCQKVLVLSAFGLDHGKSHTERKLIKNKEPLTNI